MPRSDLAVRNSGNYADHKAPHYVKKRSQRQLGHCAPGVPHGLPNPQVDHHVRGPQTKLDLSKQRYGWTAWTHINAVSPVASSQKTTGDTGTLVLATGAEGRVYTKQSEKKAPSQASFF